MTTLALGELTSCVRDPSGRTVIVTADGRSATSNGLSITETGDVAHDLGMILVMSLDGGGSTMTVRGTVTNQPSDTTGERPIGDALLILPHKTLLVHQPHPGMKSHQTLAGSSANFQRLYIPPGLWDTVSATH